MGAPVRLEDPAAKAAAEELYGAPLRTFAAERKRLAAQLASGGDKGAARGVTALPRPTMAAWVVNRLWREAQDEMEALFDAGGRMRTGDAGAWSDQRALLAALAARAAVILASDRHAASPATLRRVTSTLQSLSAAGGFAPDDPGQLAVDRDAPGFEVLGGELPPPPDREHTRKKPPGRAPEPAKKPAKKPIDRRAQAAAEQARKRAEKAQRRADAIAEEVGDLRADVARAEKALARTRAALEAKEAALAAALADAGDER